MADSELQLRPGSELARREFRKKGREVIVTITGRLKVKSPLQYSLVKDISCLTPEALLANQDGQMIKFRRVVRTLKDAYHVKLVDCDDIVGEFKEFADSVALSPKFSQSDRTERLDTLYHESLGFRKSSSAVCEDGSTAELPISDTTEGGGGESVSKGEAETCYR